MLNTVEPAPKGPAPEVSVGEIRTLETAPDGGEVGAVSLGDMRTIGSARGEQAGAVGVVIGGRYELLEEIGRGGFARVWRARDRKLGRIVAVKRLLGDLVKGGAAEQTLARFRREAQAIAQLNHRNIVAVYDHDPDADGDYIVMEYVEGGSLRAYLKSRGGKLPVPEALELVRGIARGLAYAHRKNLVHRDIKPGNILLAKDPTAGAGETGEGLIPKIVDFGLARVGSDSELSMTGYGMGTPWYMPPEQRRDAKNVNHTADIYALGKVLYELVTGEVPDNVDPEKIPPVPHLGEVIFKSIKSNPEERYFSADEMLKALEGVGTLGAWRRVRGTGTENACPSCGAANEPDVKFCESCGAGLTRLCPECGRENSIHRQFCGGCGTDVEGFLAMSAALSRMEEQTSAKRWSRVIKEYGLLSKETRLPGEKGKALLDRLRSLAENAKANEERKNRLRQEIISEWTGRPSVQEVLDGGHRRPPTNWDGLQKALQELALLVGELDEETAGIAGRLDVARRLEAEARAQSALREKLAAGDWAGVKRALAALPPLPQASAPEDQEALSLLTSGRKRLRADLAERVRAQILSAWRARPSVDKILQEGRKLAPTDWDALAEAIRELTSVVGELDAETAEIAGRLDVARRLEAEARAQSAIREQLDAGDLEGATEALAALGPLPEGVAPEDREATALLAKGRNELHRLRVIVKHGAAALDAWNRRDYEQCRQLCAKLLEEVGQDFNLSDGRRKWKCSVLMQQANERQQKIEAAWEQFETVRKTGRPKQIIKSVAAVLPLLVKGSPKYRSAIAALKAAQETQRRRRVRACLVGLAALLIVVGVAMDLMMARWRHQFTVAVEKGDLDMARRWAVRLVGSVQARNFLAYHDAKLEFEAELQRAGGIEWLRANAGQSLIAIQERMERGRRSYKDPVKGLEEYRVAMQLLRAAIQDYQDRRRAQELAAKLHAARTAKVRGDWLSVRDAAADALKLDSENPEELALKREAEINLVPKLKLVTTVDGREVPVTIMIGGKTYRSSQAIPLRKGERYTAMFSYEDNGRWYRADAITETANWQGERMVTVTLRKEPRPGDEMTVDLGGGVTMVFCWIPPGEFIMGSPDNEVGRDDDEGPQHRGIITSGFWMGKYEVTQRQYQQLMGKNPSWFKNAGPDAPVESVTWHEAKEFCEKLQARLPAAMRGKTVRLPTEAEWEYACRAGTTAALNNGKGLTSESGRCPNLEEVAWYHENSGGTTRPIGQKKANAWGLHDMHGNV